MTEFRTVQINGLYGPPLDWAVGYVLSKVMHVLPPTYGTGPRLFIELDHPRMERFRPSSDIGQGAKLAFEHGITMSKAAGGYWESYRLPTGEHEEGYHCHNEPLVAAMRCLVFTEHKCPVIDIPVSLYAGG